MNQSLNLLRKFRFPILLVGLGLVVLSTLNFFLQLSAQTFIYPDSFSYFDAATDLFLHGRGHCYRPIGIAFLSGLPYLFGAKGTVIFGWSFYVNVFCWLGSALLIYALLKQNLASKWAFVCALLYVLCVGPATITFHLLTENSYTFLLLFFLYYWFRYQATSRYIYLAIGISVLLFSMLVKPGSKFLALGVLLYSIKTIYEHRKAPTSWLIYGTLGLIALQLVGMKAQFGNFTLSYIDGITYHNYLCTKAVCYQEGVPYHQINNERAAYLHQFSLPERKTIAAADLKKQLTTNTWNLGKAYVSNVWDNTISGSPYIQDCVNRNQVPFFDRAKSMLFSISKWQNRLFTLAGMLLVFWLVICYKQKGKSVLMAGFVILYTVLLSGVSCSQGDRFHLVIYPIVLILLAHFVQAWAQKKR